MKSQLTNTILLSVVVISMCLQLCTVEAWLYEKKLMKAGAAWGIIGAGAVAPFVAPILLAREIYQGGDNAKYFPSVIVPLRPTHPVAL